MDAVKYALELRNRTGLDAFAMSPRQIYFAIRTMAETDRRMRVDMAMAVAAAMGSKEASERLTEI